jgi:hypothetical protein
VKRIQGRILVLCCIVLCLTAAGSRAAGDRIAFLDIRIVRGEPRLEGVKIVEGRLKIPRALHLDKGRLYCEVLDASGETLFETVVHDPSVERIEYAGDDGRLHTKILTREDAFISIRIPYDTAARTLVIYRIETSPDGGRLVKRANRLGSMPIDVREGGHE